MIPIYLVQFSKHYKGHKIPNMNISCLTLTMDYILQVPDTVLDKSSMAYNKGKIFIHGANKTAANAYRKQFQTDLAGFLKMRSREMKKGGSMFIALLGRTSEDPTDQGGAGLLFGTHFQDAWDDLVQEVIMSYHDQKLFIFTWCWSSLMFSFIFGFC